MKKQKIAVLLSLAWLIGMVAVFSFPPSIKKESHRQSHHSELSEITAVELVFRSAGQSPEVPAFKAELNFADLVSSQSSISFASLGSHYFSPSFFTKSRPLFDVLITFFYFFHTW
ncbi:hypothetical protein [Algoriphagus jejuensis]|uniref:hypothetical protein n=1 Tax=Algoriphagus jejuensis TaxID=419934 RepID=UPI0031DACDA2